MRNLSNKHYEVEVLWHVIVFVWQTKNQLQILIQFGLEICIYNLFSIFIYQENLSRLLHIKVNITQVTTGDMI